MSPCARRIAFGVAALGAAGLLASAIGLVPVAASSGHWAITDWLLHFTMRRSVQIRAWGVGPPPELADPALVMRGAGHYATGCAFCHGAPGATASAVTGHMTPPPPALASRIAEWSPAELFWIVRHGIKFTGMPAWPAQQRPDEVWAVVAFLLRLPDLTPEDYRRLAFGETDANGGDTATRLHALAEPLRQTVVSCGRCHGADGLGRITGAFPRLAGQRETYLAATLDAYAEGTRFSGIMRPIAAGLDDAMRDALARYFSELPPGSAPPTDPALKEQGARIARNGVPARKVAACIPCHGPGEGSRNPYYPLLAGQDASYLATQLQLFIEGQRGGTVWAEVMEISAHRLNREETAAVAAYYAALAPSSSGTETSGRDETTALIPPAK